MKKFIVMALGLTMITFPCQAMWWWSVAREKLSSQRYDPRRRDRLSLPGLLDPGAAVKEVMADARLPEVETPREPDTGPPADPPAEDRKSPEPKAVAEEEKPPDFDPHTISDVDGGASLPSGSLGSAGMGMGGGHSTGMPMVQESYKDILGATVFHFDVFKVLTGASVLAAAAKFLLSNPVSGPPALAAIVVLADGHEYYIPDDPKFSGADLEEFYMASPQDSQLMLTDEEFAAYLLRVTESLRWQKHTLEGGA